MPRNGFYRSKAEKILKRAVEYISEHPETYSVNSGESPPSATRWVATLFVQLHVPNDCVEATLHQTLETYHTKIKQIVAGKGGDVVATTDDALVALFSAPEETDPYAQAAIDAAIELMDEITAKNKRRLAQDLTPFRVGVGVDCGRIPAGEANRHPRLAVSLEGYLKRARHLSTLNGRTPFLAVFVSRSTLDGLATGHGYNIQALGNAVMPDQQAPIGVHAILFENGSWRAT